MNAKQIFEEIEKRIKRLEEMAYATIEGNTEEDKYVYSEEDRKHMQKEIKVLEETMSFMDVQMDIIGY